MQTLNCLSPRDKVVVTVGVNFAGYKAERFAYCSSSQTPKSNAHFLSSTQGGLQQNKNREPYLAIAVMSVDAMIASTTWPAFRAPTFSGPWKCWLSKAEQVLYLTTTGPICQPAEISLMIFFSVICSFSSFFNLCLSLLFPILLHSSKERAGEDVSPFNSFCSPCRNYPWLFAHV